MNNYMLGKGPSERIMLWASREIQEMNKNGIRPVLATVRMGEKSDDISYENSIMKKMNSAGIETKFFCLKENESEERLLELIASLNHNDEISGIMVFFPLPKHINQVRVKEAIAVKKDVDGSNPLNFAGIAYGKKDSFAPCTATAVVEMLKYYKIEIEGKRVVVLGRSMVVGKPLALLLLNENATVTLCHSKTEDLPKITKTADILVCAIGKGRMIDEEYINKNMVIIDCGVNFIDGQMCGDVDASRVLLKCRAITPVPKGLGAVTTAVLVQNVIKAAKLNA